MANPKRVVYSTTGAKAWIPVDHRIAPFEVSCFTEGGTAGNIEFTVDDLFDGSITPAVAGTISNNVLTTPATGVRINVNAAPLTFKILQSGR